MLSRLEPPKCFNVKKILITNTINWVSMWQGVTIWNIKDWIFSQICLGSLANTRPGPFLNYDLWKFGPFCPWKQSASMPKCGQMGRERAQFQNFRFWKWFLMVNLKLLKKCVGLNLVANIQLLIALVKKKTEIILV